MDQTPESPPTTNDPKSVSFGDPHREGHARSMGNDSAYWLWRDDVMKYPDGRAKGASLACCALTRWPVKPKPVQCLLEWKPKATNPSFGISWKSDFSSK